MREIKFRVWDKRNSCFITEENREDDKFDNYWDESSCNHAYLPVLLLKEPYSEDVIYEQYTGLKDKNGKEIYEGDILNLNSSENSVTAGPHECKYMHDGFFIPSNYGPLSLKQWSEFSEIIGNIHENKELIK